MARVLLELRDIKKSYENGSAKKVEVLHGINLKICQGEFVAIVGPSGSGKSTLMNILGCLDTPTEGSYIINSQSTSNMEPDELASLRRDFFGFVFQRYHLLTHLTASENVQVPAVYSNLEKNLRIERAHSMLERLGLKHKMNSKPNHLSGGQQQRVSIARALMNGGQIILADEPTGALDSKNGLEVMEILKELNSKGHTIILITHDAKVAAAARRVITIKDGMIESEFINDNGTSLNDFVRNYDDISFSENWVNSLFAFFDRFKESYKNAIRAMVSKRLRTLLTMLGIIIGIMSVVSVVAFARGASDKVIANISSMGSNTIMVLPGKYSGDVKASNVKTLTVKDILALKGQPFIDSVSPTVTCSGYVQRGNLEANTTVYGISSDYFSVYSKKAREGRLFSFDESAMNPQIVVIDANTRLALFPNEDAVGKHIMVRGRPLTVVGVLSGRGDISSSMRIYVPYSTLMTRLIKRDYLSSIIIRLKDNFSPAVAEDSITNLLKARHGRQDFYLRTTDTVLRSITRTNTVFTLLILAIAFISLLVGGIGVMNIMLVSVTERTREIGIRMAIGARQSDIMTQFLIEAVTICVAGGIAGVTLSVIAGLTISHIFPSLPVSFSLASLIVALLTSSAIGMIFGYMPARAASKLNPIDALARE